MEKTEKNKFEKYKKIKLHLTPEVEKLFTGKEADYIYAEVIRRLEWEFGEEWLSAHADEEVPEIITKKAKEVSNAYFQRKARDSFVEKLAELITKAMDNQSEKI
jgi:hypothetical protein